MNQQFNNNPSTPDGQFQQPSVPPPPPASSSYASPMAPPEQPNTQQQPPAPPVSYAPQPPMSPAPEGYEAAPVPVKSKTSWILIIVLVILLILGGLVFASWEGWVTLGGVEKLWTKSSTSTSTAPATSTATPTTTANTNDLQRKTDLANLKDALRKYFQANQAYPIVEAPQKTSDSSSVLSVLVPTYITKIPVDPLSPTKYYDYQSDGKIFTITAALEDTTDPAGIKTGSVVIYKVTDSSTETPTTSTNESSSTTTDTTTDTTTPNP